MLQEISKVTIITVTYNSESTVRDTLESVSRQTYPYVEHIIIDGNSNDSTLSIIAEFAHISNVISEPDKGIYDAMNKGIALANGSIIGILNSDDLFFDDNVIKNIIDIFNHNQSFDAVYGNISYFKTENPTKSIRFWKSTPFYTTFFEDGYIMPHPSLFLKKEVYEKIKLYNPNFKISSDYELMLRAFKIHSFKPYFLDKTIVKMRVGGKSTKNINNVILANKEIYQAWKMNKLTIPLFFYVKRFTYKLKQLINRNPQSSKTY